MKDRRHLERISGMVRRRLDSERIVIDGLTPEELSDMGRLCQIAEYIVSRHEQKKRVRGLMQELVDAIYESGQSVSDIDSELDVLSVEADSSARQISDISGGVSGRLAIGRHPGVQLI